MRAIATDVDRLASIGYVDGSTEVSTYDASGALTSYRYDDHNRRESVHHAASARPRIESRLSLATVYDDNGNRLTQVEVNGLGAETTTYEYDESDRLRIVTYPDRKVTYDLDAVGNRTLERHVLADETLERDELLVYNRRHQLERIENRLLGPEDPGRIVAAYGYDANGNQISRTAGGETTLFHYDRRDQLARVDRGAETLGLYSYDHQGLRIRKSAAGVTTRYLYDQQSLLYEQDASGVTRSTYRYGADRLVSVSSTTEGERFYLLDGLRKPGGPGGRRWQRAGAVPVGCLGES